jgi:hypothetical protein
VAGCIELSDPGALSCAKSVQALSECELAACAANCPVSDPASLDAYDLCAAHADHTGCATYYSVAASCTSAVAEAGTYAAPSCLETDFRRFYDYVVPLFCGAPPADAGLADTGAE